AIIDGVIQPKTRLPASRDLASEIHVSRNTVLTAYEQLQAEGYLEARTGHGTWVAEKLPESFLNTQNKKKVVSSPKVQSS
ncbi:winged helix-turn-helix domain-containing protein, partial [Acinetobacter baumannii]